MAKVSMVNRDNKRACLESKYREQREQLKQLRKEAYKAGEIPLEIQASFQKLPLNSSPSRLKNRCAMCGRSRGYYGRFGLCRLCLRKYAMKGLIAGLKKASW